MDFDNPALGFERENGQLELLLSLTSAWTQVLPSTWIPALRGVSLAIHWVATGRRIPSDAHHGDLIGGYWSDNPGGQSIGY